MERQYVATDLCPCNGCNGCNEANNLKLRFGAHVGEVATETIRQRSKLIGIDVILVHRMLKSPVTVSEYVLLSEDLGASARHARTSWTSRTSPDCSALPGPSLPCLAPLCADG